MLTIIKPTSGSEVRDWKLRQEGLIFAVQDQSLPTESYFARIVKNGTSPFCSICQMSEARQWLEEQEEIRWEGENIDRPGAKWSFEDNLMVEKNIFEDSQAPLHVGVGRLPEWLRNKKDLLALDTYADELCISRCLAVYRGAHRQFNTRQTRELAASFFNNHRIRGVRIHKGHFSLIRNYFQQGIAGKLTTKVFCRWNISAPHSVRFRGAAGRYQTTAGDERPAVWKRVPVSVSLADILNRELEHICCKDPKELIRKFGEALVRRAVAIREDMQRYISEDFDFLPEQ